MKEWRELKEEARQELDRMTDDHRRRGFDWMMLKLVCRILHRHNLYMEQAVEGDHVMERTAGDQIATLEELMTGKKRKKRLAKVTINGKLGYTNDTRRD